MVTPEDARKLAEKIDPIDCIVSDLANRAGNALRDLASQVESLQADAARWRRLVNASEMTFPPLALVDDPENECIMIYGRGHMESIVDACDEIPSAYATMEQS